MEPEGVFSPICGWVYETSCHRMQLGHIQQHLKRHLKKYIEWKGSEGYWQKSGKWDILASMDDFGQRACYRAVWLLNIASVWVCDQKLCFTMINTMHNAQLTQEVYFCCMKSGTKKKHWPQKSNWTHLAKIILIWAIPSNIICYSQRVLNGLRLSFRGTETIWIIIWSSTCKGEQNTFLFIYTQFHHSNFLLESTYFIALLMNTGEVLMTSHVHYHTNPRKQGVNSK